MSLNIVELESNYEEATFYGYNFRVKKYVYPYFLQKNLNVLILFENDATREKFAPYCLLPDVEYISAFGHGNVNLITGQDHDILWKVGSYDPKEAKDKIIHLMSCLTAEKLGQDLVDKGARAYFGYHEEFTFLHSSSVQDPLQDPYADVFFQCDSQVDRLIADGMPAAKVYSNTQELYSQKIDAFLATESDVAKCLLHDLNCFKFYGDPDACLPNNNIQELELNNPVTGSLDKSGDSRYFILKGINKGQKLTFLLTGAKDSDFDLYIRKNEKPELSMFDYRGYTTSSNEEIIIDPTGDGDYHLMVYSYDGMGPFTIKVITPPSIEGEEIKFKVITPSSLEGEEIKLGDLGEEIELGDLIVGSLASEDDSKKYVIKNVGEGEDLFVALDGPDGSDFDIYVKFGSPATIKDYDIRGYTGMPYEKVDVYPTKKGDYYITVYSYKGSGEYKLRASL
jgi:hypothetical protein